MMLNGLPGPGVPGFATYSYKKVTDEPALLTKLNRKQQFYIKMINSLASTSDLDPEQAKVQSKHLNQFHKEYIANQSEIASITIEYTESARQVEASSKAVEQKVRKIQTQLERVISTTLESVTPIPAPTMLLRKQKYYIEMIDALESSDNLNQKEAEVQSKHLKKYHGEFISNQSEITASMEDASLQDQVEISLSVQQKVRKIQAKLEEIISPSKTIPQAMVPPTNSLLNDHFTLTGRSQVIVDYLDSLMKKQKSLMEQIELIESKNDVGATEAETLHTHLSQLHDTFVKNQSKIETYVNGPALDEQLQINGDILLKVMTLQTKLKDSFAVVKPSSENVSSNGAQLELPYSIDYVNWLFERLTALKSDIRGYSYPSRDDLQSIEKLWTWFISYQNKLKQLVAESPYDLKRIQTLSDEIQSHISNYRSRLEEREERIRKRPNATFL